MNKALIDKNKFKFVNNSIPVLGEFDPSHDAWERCNNMVHSWIINFVSPSIAKSLCLLRMPLMYGNNLKKDLHKFIM